MLTQAKGIPKKKQLQPIKEIDDIQLSLIKGNLKVYCGFDDFEKVFEKKRMIGDAIGEFQGKNKAASQNIALMRQRIVQIEHLADRAEKQGVLLRNQIAKVNDAHTMNKILTIEKMIRAKQENDELQRKRDAIFRVREDRSRAHSFNNSIGKYRTEKFRQMSMLEDKHFREALSEKQSQTLEVKRSRADKVREDKQRLRDKLRRYEQFRTDKARKNYEDKLLQLKETLEDREKQLDGLYREELKEERNFETTEQVTKEYIGSLFPTETI